MSDSNLNGTHDPAGLAAILPVHPLQRDRMDLFRAAALIKSLITNKSLTSFDEFIIVVPDAAVSVAGALAELYAEYDCIKVVSEDKIFSKLENSYMSGIGGWHKQQLVKLACSRLTSSPCILTLDSDILNFSELRMSDLAPKGGIPIQYGIQFDAWKEASSKVLAVPPPARTMGVTPAFLSRNIIVELHNLLERKGSNWVDVLSSASKSKVQWTEYMLYQMAGTHSGLWDQVHVEACGIIYRGAWRNTRLDEPFYESIRSEKPVFFVNQSVRSDSDEVHSDLYSRGLPSLYDLDTNVLKHLYSSVNQSTISSDRRAHNESLMSDVHQIAADYQSNDHNELNASFLHQDLRRPIAKLVEHIIAKDFSTAKEILSQMYVPEVSYEEFTDLYYTSLLKSSSYVLLTADIVWRISECKISLKLLNKAVTGLALKGQYKFVSILLLRSRKLFRNDQGFHTMCAIVYSMAEKERFLDHANRRAALKAPKSA